MAAKKAVKTKMGNDKIVGTWINTLHHVPTPAKAGIIALWKADPEYISHSEAPEDTGQTLWTLIGVFGPSG